MKDSHGTYDGRKPEPPYPAFSENEYRQLISKLQSRNELLSEEIRWVNICRSGSDATIAKLRTECDTLKAALEKFVTICSKLKPYKSGAFGSEVSQFILREARALLHPSPSKGENAVGDRYKILDHEDVKQLCLYCGLEGIKGECPNLFDNALVDGGVTPNKIITWDGGEPEDQRLNRDWKWVAEEMNKLDASRDSLVREISKIAERVAMVHNDWDHAPKLYAVLVKIHDDLKALTSPSKGGNALINPERGGE